MDSRDNSHEATVVKMTFPAKDGSSAKPGSEAKSVSFSDELRKRGKLAQPNSLETKITNLIQRLAHLIDENRNEIEVVNKRVDNLTLTLRRLLGELHEHGIIR